MEPCRHLSIVVPARSRPVPQTLALFNATQIHTPETEARVQDRRFLRTVSSAERISRFDGEISPFWRRSRAGQDQGAVVRSDPSSAQTSRRGYAVAAAHVSGVGVVAHHLFSTGCAPRAV